MASTVPRQTYEGKYDMGLPSREARATSGSHFYSVMSAVTETQGRQGKVCPEKSSLGKEERGRERVQEGAALVVSLTFSFFKNKEKRSKEY